MVRAAWDADRQLFLVLRQIWYPNSAGCLQKGSGSCYHLTTALASLKSIQHIHGVGQRGLPELPAAQPRGSQLHSCHVSDPDCQDWAASECQPSSQIELRLWHPIWSGVLCGICRKLSLKPVQQHNWHSPTMPQGSRFFSL